MPRSSTLASILPNPTIAWPGPGATMSAKSGSAPADRVISWALPAALA